MPLNPALLSVALVGAVQPADPLGIAAWTAIGPIFCTWTIASCVFTPTAGTPLVAAGPVIAGTGGFTVAPAAPLGVLLAAVGPSLDAAGIAKWLDVANEYRDWVVRAVTLAAPSGLIGYVNAAPAPGPVTGLGLLTISGDPDFAGVLGLSDAAGIARWTAVGAALKTNMMLGAVTPTGLVNPGTGGPVTGVGTLT